MKKTSGLINSMPVLIVLLLLITACKKGGSAGPAPGTSDTCIITGETTTLLGNEASFTYEYNDKGFPSKITKYNKYNQLEFTHQILFDGVVHTAGTSTVTTSYDANLHTLPIFLYKSNVTIDLNGLTQVNFYTFFFFYDSKGRITKIGQQTNHVTNDHEWDLNITYNDQNNVTMLQYEWTTGPRTPIAPIIVKAYDNKPTPYAGIRNYRFLMNNYAWDNYDPEPLLTALSANNPLDYTMNTGTPQEFKRTMTYTYNEKGFPVERLNTNKNVNGTYTFKQTFTYNCK
jgi:hypothetical protein